MAIVWALTLFIREVHSKRNVHYSNLLDSYGRAAAFLNAPASVQYAMRVAVASALLRSASNRYPEEGRDVSR